MSVERDQLLCLPLPLTPAKGFSWSRHASPCREATCFITSMVRLVVVSGDVAGGEQRRQLMLARGRLVVLGFGEDPQFPELLIQILHIGRYPGLDHPKIVVFQLLPFGWLGAQQGAPGVHQILALLIHLAVNQEVFLFRPHSRNYAGGFGIPEKAKDTQRMAVQGVDGAQQRGFAIQSFPPKGTERSGNTQRSIL